MTISAPSVARRIGGSGAIANQPVLVPSHPAGSTLPATSSEPATEVPRCRSTTTTTTTTTPSHRLFLFSKVCQTVQEPGTSGERGLIIHVRQRPEQSRLAQNNTTRCNRIQKPKKREVLPPPDNAHTPTISRLHHSPSNNPKKASQT